MGCGCHAESNAELIHKLGKCLRNLDKKFNLEILGDMLTQYKKTEGRLADAELIDKLRKCLRGQAREGWGQSFGFMGEREMGGGRCPGGINRISNRILVRLYCSRKCLEDN